MMLRRQRRKGSVLIEAAMVYPVLIVLMLGIILLSIGVFRYQQVAHIAREASRWAAVRGAKYAQETGNAAATKDSVFDNAIKPQAAGMRLTSTNLTYDVTWQSSNAQTTTKTVTVGGVSTVKETANTVTVTVTYTWNTGLFGNIPVSSTSVMVMSY